MESITASQHQGEYLAEVLRSIFKTFALFMKQN